MLLGCIADDVTGATDLADTLVRAGLRTRLLLGVPGSQGEARRPAAAAGRGAVNRVEDDVEDDAVVVALKIRTVPAADAVAQALDAARWLRLRGAERLYDKYCSTFDSTDEGNIGPVADALLDAVGGSFTVFCPAFPAAGRTVYAGHLFVGDVLLSESSMRDHPLTPMTDPDLVRVLGRQTPRPVGLVHLRDVLAGEEHVRRRFAELQEAQVTHAVVDAVSEEDLRVIGRAAVDLRLATGGSGLGGGLARALAPAGTPAAWVKVPVAGPVAIFAGSCSAATAAQVASFEGRRVVVDPLALPDELETLAARVADAVAEGGPLLVASTAPPAAVEATQRELGRQEAGQRVEEAMGHLARVAVEAGARRLVVAGGETAGAVTAALGVRSLEVGPTIARGVPWTAAVDTAGRPLALACKSGNFGGPAFFADAVAVLERGP